MVGRLIRWGTILAAMAVVGYVNIHTDEIPIVLTIVLSLSFGIGVLWPKRAWRWAFCTGLALPISQVLAMAFNWHVPYPNTWGGGVASLFAIIPGLIGVYAGVAGRSMAQSVGPVPRP